MTAIHILRKHNGVLVDAVRRSINILARLPRADQQGAIADALIALRGALDTCAPIAADTQRKLDAGQRALTLALSIGNSAHVARIVDNMQRLRAQQ